MSLYGKYFIFLLPSYFYNDLHFMASTACKLCTTRYYGGRWMSTTTRKGPKMCLGLDDFLFILNLSFIIHNPMLICILFNLQFLI